MLKITSLLFYFYSRFILCRSERYNKKNKDFVDR